MAETTITDRATRNVELFTKGYAAFGAGDLQTVEAMFEPDAVWHAQRLGTLSGDHAGWPAVLGFFGRTMELSGGTFRVAVQEIMANDDGAAVVVRSTAERNGKQLDSRQVHLYRVRGDRVVEAWQFAGPEADDFWS
ncbi:MAG TPA: nuclear transport factor 2 family protein [Actinomycetota bacterium]|jgi:hypothetical protein